MEKIALIAGGGSLPLEFIRRAEKKGIDLTVFAVEGETGKETLRCGFKVVKIGITGLGTIIKRCKKEGIKKILMLGYISHTHVLKGIRFDIKTLSVLLRLKDFRAASILKGVVDEFEKNGIRFLSSVYLMDDLLAKEGLLAGPKPADKLRKDALLAFKMAAGLAKLDIGQTVVVKNGVVVAAEGQEGTDECVARGAKIGGSGFVAGKAARPGQDMRYDVPVIGPRTIRRIAELGGKGIVIEANKTMIIDSKEVYSLADRKRVFILSCRRK